MASLPNSAEIARNRDAISSKAWSQEIRSQVCVRSVCVGTAAPGCPCGAKLCCPASGPLGPIRLSGYNTRSGEYTRSRYFATLAHKNPRVTGCSGSP